MNEIYVCYCNESGNPSKLDATEKNLELIKYCKELDVTWSVLEYNDYGHYRYCVTPTDEQLSLIKLKFSDLNKYIMFVNRYNEA